MKLYKNVAGIFALLILLAVTPLSFAEDAPAVAPSAETTMPEAAESAAVAPAAEPAPAAAATPKCGDKGYDCNKGDTAWLMTSTAFVLFMTVPGLALYYDGMVREKNALSTVMQSFSLFCIIDVLWVAFGYSAAFTAGLEGYPLAPCIGALDKMFMAGVDPTTGVAATFSKGQYVPDFVYCMFQLTFAAITVALIAGGYAERMKFSAVIIFSVLWFTFAYLPIAHMVWKGWFGFNAGSALEASGGAGLAVFNTLFGTAVAGVTWTACEWLVKGKPSLLGVCSGIVTGLVAITPAAGYVGPIGALLICATAGVVCFIFVTKLKPMLGYDDALDAFGVHCIGGIIGSIGTGIFVNPALGGTGVYDYVANKVADFDASAQIVAQLWDIGVTLAWSGLVALLILVILKHTIGIRVKEEEEEQV